MNKKVGLVGLFLFLLGIYISQWTLLGMVMGIGGGIIMGISAVKFPN